MQNGTQNRLNTNSSLQAKKISKVEMDVMNTNSGGRDQFSNSRGAGSSLKEKLIILDDSVKQISDEFTAYRKDANDLQAQKDRTAKKISTKSDGVKENLKNEIGKVDEEMKKHFSHHKAENSRLQQQISQLQGEKNNIQNQLTALQRRIGDIEMQVGNDN